MFQIYLPIAEMSVNVWLLLVMGGGVGFLSGLFGIGGGFLLTPLLIFIGIPPAIAVGTQANQSVASATSGMFAHRRNRHVDINLALLMLCGGIVGTLIGSMIFGWLQSIGQIDFLVSGFYVLFLGTIGSLMLYESLRIALHRRTNPNMPVIPRTIPRIFEKLPYKRKFATSGLEISIFVPLGVGLVVGMTTVMLGLGGSLLVPAMIYLMAMPAALVAGTSLFQVIFMSSSATFLHATGHQTVDLVLAFPLMVGGVLGAQIGSRFAGQLRPDIARLILALLVLGVALRLFVELTIPPEAPYTLEVMTEVAS